MPSFIDFRKEYLEENPGSSMTIVRTAYYKSIGKSKPKKQSRKKTHPFQIHFARQPPVF